MSEVEQLVDNLSKLTVLELVQLKKALEEKWEVSAAPMVSSASVAVSAAGDQDGESKEEESTEFEISLLGYADDKKISIIKVVREVTGLGLKEAKDIVIGDLPAIVKTGVSKSDSEEMKKKFEDAGAKVDVKGL